MAVKNRGINFKVFDKIRDAISELQLETLPEIAEYVRKRIETQAKSGKTMVSGESEKLKSLSPNYVAARKKWKKQKKTVSPLFSPARSNLTVSGQYLESISVVKIDLKECSFTIAPSGPRTGEKLSNRKLGEYLADMGFSIAGIDKTGKKVVSTMVKADIARTLKRKLLNK